MRAQIPLVHTGCPSSVKIPTYTERADIALLKPLFDLAADSDSLSASNVGVFPSGVGELHIPRFIFMGPKGGGDTIRLGLFATFHGDEPEGAEALAAFFKELERSPKSAKGFHLFAYPLCNPGGLIHGSRNNLAGSDLTAELWKQSSQPEAYYLEREMGIHGFQGVISVHTNKNSAEFTGTCRSSLLDEALVRPALERARTFFLDISPGIAKTDENIPSGFLTATDELRPTPFEINLGIPGQSSKPSQIAGAIAVLKSILTNYRSFIALHQNL